MSQNNVADDEPINDSGYYTPKNILNPAMFRLAEITRALSEVNMEVEKEHLNTESHRHTVFESGCTNEDYLEIKENFDVEACNQQRTSTLRKYLNEHEDELGRLLLIILALSVGLFLLLLCFSWPE